jgi:hypothetical protein
MAKALETKLEGVVLVALIQAKAVVAEEVLAVI